LGEGARRADEGYKAMKRIPNQKLQFSRRLRKRQTPQEIVLWSKLRNRRFLDLKFRRQHSIGNYIVDFICLEKKVIIEIDGSGHQEQKSYDNKRDIYFKEEGYKVLRFWNNEINNNLEGVLLKIEDSIK